ncbi:MAG: hypothetical protein P4L35_12090 [Ignavibacteriaceae bacterium]|nr:hypothetical protein [Ignavibacteriaceae bacterium]
MKIAKKIFLIVLLLGFSRSFAQDMYVNPGIKLGYMFGENGGFVIGFELSVTRYDNKTGSIWGLVLDLDETVKMTKLHLGVESSTAFLGLDAGPAFIWQDNKGYWGFSFIPYGGVFLYPYYNFTFNFQNIYYHEIGSYIKFTIPNKNNESVRFN